MFVRYAGEKATDTAASSIDRAIGSASQRQTSKNRYQSVVGTWTRIMLEYVEQITKDATRITPEFHGRLRVVGFDDRGILQITLLASWFNYINRVADALGVGRDG